MKSLRTLKVKAFTLIEMLVVLLIISVLLLLFVPNLTKQKDSVTDTGNRAVVKVVESQAELYELNHQNEKASLSKLVAEGQITQKQAEAYRAHYVKNAGDHRAVADSSFHPFRELTSFRYRQSSMLAASWVSPSSLWAGRRNIVFLGIRTGLSGDTKDEYCKRGESSPFHRPRWGS